MATKTAPQKKAVAKKATVKRNEITKPLSIKRPKNEIEIDNRLTPEQKKNRDKMLSVFENSHDEDLKHIISVYNDAPEWTKENMREHYEINGSLFINAVFTGDKQTAYDCAPLADKVK